MSKEIAKKFENQLSKYYLQTIHDLLEEQEINPQQFMHMAVNQIKRNNKLLDIFKSNPASIFSSILTCAEFGLSPTSQMGEAWLIPYGKECQFQIGYQGLTKILYKNPDVQNITAECVYENDEFDYSLGLSPTLEHKPATIDRGNLTAVYCVVRFANQLPIFKVMTIQELKTIQKLSKAGNRSVWFSKTDPQYWMLKKTVFKQLCKLLPKHLNMSKVISYDNIVEGGGAMRLDDENKPIVIEEESKTRADKFEKAMKEDEEPIILDIPGFEGTKEALNDLCDIRKDKTKPLLEKCPVPGIDAVAVNVSKPQEDEEEEIPSPEELIPAIKEDENPEPITEPTEPENIKKQTKKSLEEYEDERMEDELDFHEEQEEEEREMTALLEKEKEPKEKSRWGSSRGEAWDKGAEEVDGVLGEVDFEKEEEERRQKSEASQNSFLNSDISKDIDVEL